MTPGPTYIYQCPNCDNLISRRSLNSANTFQAKRYSDGKMVAPMNPVFPSITICSKCKNFFWIDTAKEIGSYDFKESIDERWINVKEAEFLTIDEYFQALEYKIFSNRDNR